MPCRYASSLEEGSKGTSLKLFVGKEECGGSDERMAYASGRKT